MVAVQEHHRAKIMHTEDRAWTHSRGASWLTEGAELGGHPSGKATAVIVDTLVPHGLLFVSVYLHTGKALCPGNAMAGRSNCQTSHLMRACKDFII
eukprot:6467429-Amphidinium_carterae.1